MPITINEAGGDGLVFTTQPQVAFITSEGTVVRELYPDVVSASVDNLFLDYTSPASPGYAVFGKVVGG